MIETKFKQTEIGLIPKEWETYFIEDITNTTSGGTPSRSVSQYFLGNIKWFTTSELNDCELNDSLEHISEDALKSSSCKLFPSGTLLMAMYGATIGKLGILNDEAATNQACCAIFQSAIYETKFLYYWLLKERKNIITQGCGAGQPNISQSIIKKLLVPVPPIQEQQRIVTALSDIDALISALNKKIEKKKLIKQGAMQQLLTGQKRLQGFSEPWEERRLGEMCIVKRGVRVVKSQLQTSGLFPVFQNTNIPLGFYHKYNVIQDTPFVIIGGSAGQIGMCHTKYWAADDCAFFECKSALIRQFLYFMLLRSQEVILQNVRVGTVPRLDRAYLQNMPIKIPSSIVEQTAIAEILSDMDKEIAELETKRTKYDCIKQGMMQQLLTGKIRLTD